MSNDVKYLSNLCRTPVRGLSEVCRLDVETLFLLGGAFAVSIAVAIQHFYDRFHRNGLYKTAVQRTAEMPGKIGLEVEAALNRVAASQEAKYADAAEATVNSAKMSAVRNLGLEKGELKELQGVMVDGILGPVMLAIEAWNPDWAAKLREIDPALLLRFFESPWFQSAIMPRIQPLISKFMGGKAEEAGSTTENPFLKGLSP